MTLVDSISLEHLKKSVLSVCLLFGVFKAFSFNAIINKVGFTFASLFFGFCMSYAFFYSFFLHCCLLFVFNRCFLVYHFNSLVISLPFLKVIFFVVAT